MPTCPSHLPSRSSKHHSQATPTSITIPCLPFLMAATGTKQQQPKTTPPAMAVDPKFEWAEKAGSYVLRLSLQGFQKDDFRVQVDGAGRLTVSGATKPNVDRPGSYLHKVFQLPSTASLDNIAGRFAAGVLTLTMPKLVDAPKEETVPKMAPTEQVDDAMKKEDASGENKVPKRTSSGVAAPTSIDDIKMKPKEEGASKPSPRELDGAKKMPDKDNGAEKEGVAGVEPKESVFNRTKRQISEQVQRMKEEANRRKQEQQKPAQGAKKEQELEVKPKAPQAAATAVTPEKPAPKPTSGEKSKVSPRGEEERAKASIVETTREEKAEREKKVTDSACTAWKERITGELKGLMDMKWADNAVEMARKNKEVVGVGVAAFSLGFFVSQKLFSK